MRKVQRSDVKPATNVWQAPPSSSLAGLQPGTFGSFLRLERLSRSLSRPAVADRTGIPENMLEKIERNQTAPSYAQIRLLARNLELTETELLTRAGFLRR